MATDAIPRNALEQHQSLLFRLPRELRDEIYEYYVQETNGYHYESNSGKLRMDSGERINLGLQYACRRTFAEMDGIALRTNTITFRTTLDLPSVSDQLTDSEICEYYLLCGRDAILRRMLEWSDPLVTSEVMEKLCERWPGNTTVRKMCGTQRTGELSSSMRSGTLWSADNTIPIDYNPHSTQALDILRDLLDIMSADPEFWLMTASEFDLGLREIYAPRAGGFDIESRATEYTSKTQQLRVLEWEPDEWWIPTRADLDELSEFIPKDEECGPFSAIHIRGGNRSYFSAAAAATQFLGRLNGSTLKQIRNIIVLEDECSRPNPTNHARGLIPFCIANSQIKIERKVDIWRVMIMEYGNIEIYDCGADGLMREIGAWISEAKTLASLGMPAGSFNLTMHGPSPRTSQQIFDAVVKVATWDEGSTILAATTFPDYFPDNVGGGFVEIIKAMIRGEIPVTFEADMGEVWDIQELLAQDTADWPVWFEAVLRIRDLEEPQEGWTLAREERFGVWKDRSEVEFNRMDQLEGFELLVLQDDVE
ncbi:hypothetical protein J4E86_001332 [Alternaria arbusti]|uniref:uncharacterized protein n=1 Tax=Alternaria arbusti TaxID=232088 RepID=UPI00221EDF77|nr:uncharacterized protein J4E86_001332 [Alternaria arbusti]KAI4962300.1 hypothetical protein J4E86_001332 [Alternaria arbusti]